MALLFLVVLGLLVWLLKLQGRVQELEQRDEAQSGAIVALKARLEELEATRRAPAAAPPMPWAPPAAQPEAAQPEAAPSVSAPPVPLPSAAAARPAPAVPADRPESKIAAPLPMPAARVTQPPPAPAEPPRASPPAVPEPPRPPLPPAARSLPPLPPAPPRRPPPSPPPSQPFDWEALVGVKLFSWVAGIALALAAIFFLRYSIQSGWLQPPVRMAIGLLVGAGLLVVCELRVAREYPVTANAMDAAGIVILFSTFFAAFALWHLVGAGAAFALLILVTGVAVMLSIRRDSVFIALLGLLGGFSTPALLSTGQDNPVGLFGYLLLLNAGLAWVAYRKRWVALMALSLLFTTLYQWAWVGRFFSAERLVLASGIFLVFPLLGVAAMGLLGDRDTRAPSAGPGGLGGTTAAEAFGRLTAVNASLPLLFALYLASVPAYGQHLGLLFGFLLAIDAGLFAIALWRGPQVLHLVGAVATVLVFVAWLSTGATVGPDGGWASSWPAILGFTSLFVVFYLATGLTARHGRRRLEGVAASAAYAAPALLVVFPALAATEPAFADPGLPFSVLFALLALIAAFAIAEGAGTVYFVGAFMALAAEAVWSGFHLVPARLLAGLAVYGAFGLFYLGVPLIARRFGRELRPAGMPAVLLIVSILLLFFLSSGSVAASSLWGLALLLAILNLAVFAEGGAARRPLLAVAASALSWLVLLSWWLSGALAAQAIPALMIVGAFALLTLGGHVYLAGEGRDASRQGGLGLALVGHLFLFFVAAQPSLSVPPWPMLGVLGVLDLAVAVAALHVERPDMHLAAVVLTQAILAVWLVAVPAAPWPLVAVLSGSAAAALALGVALLARRRIGAPRSDEFDTSAASGLLLAQCLTVLAATMAGAPGVGTLALVHSLLSGAVLAVSALVGWPALAVVAVVPMALATLSWLAMHPGAAAWRQNLVLASPLYAIFLAYPLVLGSRVARRIEPHLAAVLASAVFFVVGRASLIAGGYLGVIGALPVAQAVLVGVLLAALLRLEPPGERALGRLALVAGTVLAFVTVAIPLQLEKEWITIAWALEGAALAWLYGRIPHRGLFWFGVGLLAVVFARLALNPEVLVYQPRGSLRIFNWYLYTYLVCAASMIAAAWLFARTEDQTGPELPRASSILPAAATVLLFLLLNIEIADFYSVGPSITFNLSAGLAQDLTYTLGWGAFAVGLLVAGIYLRSHFARMSAIVLLTITVLKGFLHDMARLGGLYRVFSFVGLAVCLSLVALVLQRFVLRRRDGATE